MIPVEASKPVRTVSDHRDLCSLRSKMKRELLFSVTRKDLVVTWYKSSGSGGQKKNKTANACRIQHPESGALVTASERRERPANQAAALHRLVKHPKFRLWHAQKFAELEQGRTLQEEVAKQMIPNNLRVDVKEKGCWVEESEKKKKEN